MHKIYTLLIAAFLVNISVSYASNTIDSIGIENNKGKKLIVHRVEVKETYYAIAKKYNVNYKDVMTFNDSKFLQVGVIIKVPTDVPFDAVSTPTTTNDVDLIEYTIKAKDNLNMLAEKYGTTVNEIKRVNNLNSINLQIGQVLKIPTNGAAPQEVPIVATPSPSKTETDQKTVVTTNTATSEHSVKAKENLGIIAEKYGTTIDQIKRLNGLTSSNLRIGQILKIPNANNSIAETVPQVTTSVPVQRTEPKQVIAVPNNDGSFEHIVANGETIYSIAKKYNLTTYQLKTANGLTTNEVSVGQKLFIKGTKPITAIDDETPTGSANTIKDPSLRYAPSTYGIIQVEEKGTAVWIADPDLDATKMLVLHRTAPIGTIIKVTNPMSNRSAFAKVVGKFTENESTKDVIIVMTKAVADAVGALDKRFFCNLTYGAQENEQ